MSTGATHLVEVHIRINKKAEADFRHLSNSFRTRALAALAAANKRIAVEMLKASKARLNAKLKKSRAGGRADGSSGRGLRALLSNMAVDGSGVIAPATHGGWAHGAMIGNPKAIARAGVQDYWRSLEQGSTALVGTEFKGSLLNLAGKPTDPLGGLRVTEGARGGYRDRQVARQVGQPLPGRSWAGSPGSIWAEGRMRVNGATGSIGRGFWRIIIRNPIPAYGYLQAAQDRLEAMISSGETLRIYQEEFNAAGLQRINLTKRNLGTLHTLRRARTIELIAH